ncbi:MAG TPA: glycosyltransferase, partial [bacterium]|nr:glycosyltransferase [bacterium]
LSDSDQPLLRRPGVLRRWGARLRALPGVGACIVAMPDSPAAVQGTAAAAGWSCCLADDEQTPRLLAAATAFRLTAVLRLTPDNLLVPNELLIRLLQRFAAGRCAAVTTDGFPQGIAASVISTALLRALMRAEQRMGTMPHPVNALRVRPDAAVLDAEPRYWCRQFAQWRGCGRVVLRGRGERVPALDLRPDRPATRRWSTGADTPPVATMVRQLLRDEARQQTRLLAVVRPAHRAARSVLMLNHTAIGGGAEHSFLETARGLQRRGWRVHTAFLADGIMTAQARRLGLPVTVLADDGAPWSASLRLARLMEATRCATVYANSVQSLPAVVLPAAERGLRLVAHVREFLDPSEIRRQQLGAAAVVIANSHATAAFLQAYLAAGRVQVVHNGIDAAAFAPRAVALRTRRPLPAEFIIGVFGRLVPYKGQHTAIAALAILRRRGLDAGLVLAGSSFGAAQAAGYRQYLQQQAEALRLEPHISWHDHVPKVATLMAQVDAVAVPTEGEPFGRVVLEALALGKPVIATDDGGPRELLPQRCLVPADDPLALAERLAALHQKSITGPDGPAILKRFTMTRYLDRVAALLAGTR